MWAWAWGVLICAGCVISAGVCTPEWPFWVFVEKGVDIRRLGVVGAVLTLDPRLVIETGQTSEFVDFGVVL